MYEGYVAVSAAKSHFSIHFSDEAFLNRLAESLPACKKGKRCINIKYGDEVSLHAVEKSIDDFLKFYHSEGSASQSAARKRSAAAAPTAAPAASI